MPPDNVRPKRASPRSNVTAYVRELIGQDQRKQRVHRLHTLVEVGLDSGPATPDTPEDWAELYAIARGDLEGIFRGRLRRPNQDRRDELRCDRTEAGNPVAKRMVDSV